MRPHETSVAYPEVLATWGRWRLIVSADARPATQWIMQRWRRPHWRGVYHFQARKALSAYAAREGGAPPEALAIIDALPDFCPQKNGVPGCSQPQSALARAPVPAGEEIGS